MTNDQILIFSILLATLVLFLWNRWRYDLVAMFALLVVTVVGLIPASQAFMGLGHPAVITVGAVLLISRGLLNAGVVGLLARQLSRVGERPWVQVGAMCGLVAVFSGFMNNVGALALFMPVAIWMSRQSGRPPSFLLMPVAFASLLGGTLTLIGTPPNIIISSFREQVGGVPFGMFDFLPVGAVITVVGVACITLGGWRLIPSREENNDDKDIFHISSYLTELRLPLDSKFSGLALKELLVAGRQEADFTVVALIRDGDWKSMPSPYLVLNDKDILLVEADVENIQKTMDHTGLELVAEAENKEKVELDTECLKLMEVVIANRSVLIGHTANLLELRENYNINILGVARDGIRLKDRIDRIRFVTGDILLVQANEETMRDDLRHLNCLPLADRGLDFGRYSNVCLALALFVTALALVAGGVLSSAVSLSCCALVMILVGIIKVDEIYESIDMPVIVLLAAMLPLGMALESTGGSRLIAEQLLAVGKSLSPAAMLALLMVSIMLLSNILNNAAAAVMAAPVAIDLAKGLGAATDPFLMAVVIGASCPFLTPIGHQSNTLVMVPGGYQFGDYWRLGLPLSVVVVVVAVPTILWIWPLNM